MSKTLSLVKRAPEIERAEFFRRFLALCRSRAGAETFDRLVVSLVDVPPEEAGLRPGGNPAYDAVIESWSGAGPDAVAFAGVAREMHSYVVDETVEREYERDWPDGVASPGVKSFYLAIRKESWTPEAYAEHWGTTHAPLALKHHVGMWRYARNVTVETLGDAPHWDGFAELHFRTSQDLRERFFDSDEGRAVINADVAKFTAGGRALHTTEWILKS